MDISHTMGGHFIYCLDKYGHEYVYVSSVRPTDHQPRSSKMFKLDRVTSKHKLTHVTFLHSILHIIIISHIKCYIGYFLLQHLLSMLAENYFVFQDGSIEVVVLDFQTIQVSSPVFDLLYIIFTGTDKAFRDEHYQSLVDLYFTQLTKSMERLHLDPGLYTREDFDFELKEVRFRAHWILILVARPLGRYTLIFCCLFCLSLGWRLLSSGTVPAQGQTE